MPRQTEVDQVIARGPLRPGISLRSTFEVTAPVDLRGVKSMRVHLRGVEHDVVCRAVSGDVSESDSYLQSYNAYLCAMFRSCMNWRP